ncbi:hypothetical protein [uncultured Limosilactobacillus sp.]|uniref:mucin-binding protein n=1 Tax=uncultured Limosilactobacillus sp. TaxID=2837629 RepID=UPI0025EA3A1B|nr:hypothetical protein [uncultured Limosilactobacillus sp.]
MASVLRGTTLYWDGSMTTVHADQVPTKPTAGQVENKTANQKQVDQQQVPLRTAKSGQPVSAANQLQESKAAIPATDQSAIHLKPNSGYTTNVNGSQQTVTLDDGSELTVDHNVINSGNQKAKLTFKSSSFKAGDTYTIRVPEWFIDTQNDISSLPSSMGTTTSQLVNSDAEHGWFVITDHFTSTGTISQDIILRYRPNAHFDIFDGQGWAPYALASGQISLAKNNGDAQSLEFASEESSMGISNTNFSLYHGDLNYPLRNHHSYQGQISLTYAGYGLGNALGQFDVAKSFPSMNVQFTLPSEFKLTSPHVTLMDDFGKVLGTATATVNNGVLTINQVKLSAGQTPSLNKDSDGDSFNFVFNLEVNVSDSQFANGQKTVKLNHNDDHIISQIRTLNHKVTLNHNQPTDFDVTIWNNNNTEGTIGVDKQQAVIYQDGVNLYFGPYQSKTPYGQTINHQQYIGNESSQAVVAPFSNKSNDTLSDVNVHVEFPDGLNVYRLSLNKNNSLDGADRIMVFLSDGRTVELTAKDWQSVANNKEFELYSGYDLKDWGSPNIKLGSGDDKVSIKAVDIHYDQVYGGAVFGIPDSLHDFVYVTADHYANGQPVQVGDEMDIHVEATAPQLSQSINATSTRFLVIAETPAGIGAQLQIVPHQDSKTPGQQNAGHITYSVDGYEDQSNYKPQLKQPLAYLVLPANVSINGQQLSQNVQVTTGDTHQVLKPKAISFQVIDGQQVVVVDLSNYKTVYDGFDITVSGLDNTPDWLTSSKPTAMMVVSDQVSNFARRFPTVDQYSEKNGTFANLFKKLAQNGHVAANNTLVYEEGHWDLVVAKGTTIATMTSTTGQPAPALQTTQSDHTGTQMKLYNSIINGQDRALTNVKSVINLDDGQESGHFASVLSGPATVVNVNTNQPATGVTISYSTQSVDLSNVTSTQLTQFKSASQISDWSKVRAILVSADSLAGDSTYRVVMPIEDKQIYDDVNKVTQVTSNTWANNADGSVQLKPVVINAQSPASAKIKVVGQSTVKTIIRYTDAQGHNHDVELTYQAHQYQEGQDQMKRSDFLQSDQGLTALDRSQLPAHLVIDYAHPTVENSHEQYLGGYANGTAAFGKTAKYDFDQDAVVFKAVIGQPVTADHTVKETIHYVYANHQKVKDDTFASHKFTGSGYKDPQSGKIVWNAGMDSYDFPPVTIDNKPGYTVSVTPTAHYDATKGQISIITVNNGSSDLEYTVVYTPTKQTINYQIVDDTDNGKVLKTDDLVSGDSTSAVPNDAKSKLKDVVDSYLKQGYVLKQGYQVPTNFDTNDQDNQTVIVHLLHGTTVKITDKAVKRTIAYYDKTTGQELPTAVAHHAPQTVNFSQTAVTDAVTNQVIGYNTTGHYTEYTGANGQQVKVYQVDTKNADDAWQTTANSWGQVTNPDLRTAGYEPATDESGAAMPTIAKQTVSATDDDQTVKVYYVEHVVPVNATTKVTAGQPVTDHSPYQWPAKNQFDAKNYQSQSTRQIRYQFTNGTQAADPVTETVTFNRTGKMNLVTGAVTPNNDWQAVSSTIDQGGKTTGGQNVKQYEVVASPVIPGYTADKLSVAATDAVQGKNAADVVVTYAPDQQKLTYTVKDATTGQTLAKQVALPNGTGVSDGTVSAAAKTSYQQIISQYQQKGYVVDAQALPSKYDHDDQKNQNVLITLHHLVQKVTGNDPKMPDQSKLQLADLKKTATLDVKYINHDETAFTGQIPTNAHQSVTLVGTAYIDLVTGELTNKPIKDQQGNEIVNAGNHNTPEISWSTATTQAVQSPSERGYHPSDNQVPALTIKVDNNATADQGLTNGSTVTLATPTTTATITRTVTYAKDPTVKVVYIDQDNDNRPIANTGSGVLTGVAGQAVNYQTASTIAQLKRHGYVLVTNGFDPQGTAPKYDGDNTDTHTYTVALKHATTTVTPTDLKTPKDKLPDNPNKKYPNGVAKDDLNKTVTRLISLHRPNGITDNTEQKFHLTRTATVDEVTGKVVADSDWSTDQWPAYQTPTITGYTPTKASVAVVTVNGQTKDQTIDISYTADPQEIDYQVVDDNTGNVISGDQPVRLVSGVSDQGVPTEAHQDLDQVVENYQNHGYVLVSGDQVPNQFDHVDDDNQLITIHVKHATTTVTPDQPKTPADILPDNPSQHYPTGVSQDDLNKMITRTINLHLPDGSIKTIHQDAHLSRTATVDEVVTLITVSGRRLTGQHMMCQPSVVTLLVKRQYRWQE